ncbi:MAG: xylulokinase, partial [Clostridiales bacterium]|nr:xylulokinase [Clostridiales bacterium]
MGLDVEYLVASGGGARSPQWLKIQADVLNKPLRLTKSEEQASLGAAIVAGVGAGVFRDVQEGCRAIVRLGDQVVPPDPESHRAYERYHRLFQQAYAAQREVIEALTDLGRAHGNR